MVVGGIGESCGKESCVTNEAWVRAVRKEVCCVTMHG
jgi:hypothetical protein